MRISDWSSDGCSSDLFDIITAPNATFAVLLPYCDGDVSNLQGAFMYDESRNLAETTPSRKFQLVTMGANHNFYNTTWSGDDYSNRARKRVGSGKSVSVRVVPGGGRIIKTKKKI